MKPTPMTTLSDTKQILMLEREMALIAKVRAVYRELHKDAQNRGITDFTWHIKQVIQVAHRSCKHRLMLAHSEQARPPLNKIFCNGVETRSINGFIWVNIPFSLSKFQSGVIARRPYGLRRNAGHFIRKLTASTDKGYFEDLFQYLEALPVSSAKVG